MDTLLVYRKSGLGAAELAANHDRVLSPRERCVLILLNGRRTVGELCDLFGAEIVSHVVPELEALGFAKQVDPELPAEWADAITQIHVDDAGTRRAALAARRHSDWNPLAWMALATAVTFAISYWATNHYIRPPDALWRLDQAPVARALPIDAYGVPIASDAIGPQRATPVSIRPIKPLRTVAELKSFPADSLARPAPRTLVPDSERKSPTRIESRTATPAHASASAAPRPPAAGSAASSNVKVDAAAPRPARLEVATSAEAATAPKASKDSEASVESAAVKDTDPSAAETVAAVATSMAPAPAEAPTANAPDRPASDLVSLHPLRHELPKYPEQAQHEGVGESLARVHLWITAEGTVDQVDILEAKPAGVFDDELRRALSLWTFEPPGHPVEQTIEVPLKP